MSAAAALLLLTLLGRWLMAPPRFVECDGAIHLIRSPVLRQLPGSETWSELTGSGYLLPGGSLRVLDGGLVAVRFHGKSEVLVDEGSQLRFVRMSPGTGVVAWLDRGEAFLDFSRGGGGFELVTPAATLSGTHAAVNVAVLGEVDPASPLGDVEGPEGSLAVRLASGLLNRILPGAEAAATMGVRVVVTTRTGTVRVQNGYGTADVKEGTEVTIDVGAAPARPVAVDLSRRLAWVRSASPDTAQVARVGDPGDSTPKHPLPGGPHPVSPITPGPRSPSENKDPAEPKPQEPSFHLLPPVMLEPGVEFGKVRLKWVDAANTTCAILGYDLYRSEANEDSGFRRVNEVPIPVARFSTGSTGSEYEDTEAAGETTYSYCVRALTALDDRQEPVLTAANRAGLLESPASAPVAVRTLKDFRLVLTGWAEEPRPMAQILVQKWHRGQIVSKLFHVAIGEAVGKRAKVRVGGPGTSQSYAEEVDFATGYVLVDLVPDRQKFSTAPGSPDPQTAFVVSTRKALLKGPADETIELTRQP
jgi:hypothetical protein